MPTTGRVNAQVRCMDEELAGKLRAEEVRRAAVAKQAAFRDAVQGTSVGAADALLAGKTLSLPPLEHPWNTQPEQAGLPH